MRKKVNLQKKKIGLCHRYALGISVNSEELATISEAKLLRPMNRIYLLFFVVITAAFSNCRSNKPPALVEQFSPITHADTIYVSSYMEEDAQGQAIPAIKLYEALDAFLLDKMVYPLDSTDMEAFGQWTLPIDEQFDGFLLEIQQSWFVFKYLLIFSKERKKFVDLIPLGQFYGGDGGQIRMESWLFKQGDNGYPRILVRTSEHSLQITEDGPEDTYEDQVHLLQWNKISFETITVPDAGQLIQAYPMKW